MGGPASAGGRTLRSTDNFLHAPIILRCVIVDEEGVEKEEEVVWRTCEHFFQASKFDPNSGGRATWDQCRAIQEISSPIGAWELGQSRKHPLRKDWEEMKGKAMYLCVRAKFDQYPEYAAELIATADPTLPNPPRPTGKG
ncbi:N-glycosidase YbiA [Seminavis robusta]|uniref:N-glycosidase YbiA n=1 Tax=Seminavis robusta TaxID=568900 RepID=A0A9N8DKV3_9STRA|nr:N-glycosidase YbiA [Seminavis robusta]|eukprot:Sro214_g088740.1 N-glycosidase YbiA (140) ;mRNA; f:38777-39196